MYCVVLSWLFVIGLSASVAAGSSKSERKSWVPSSFAGLFQIKADSSSEGSNSEPVTSLQSASHVVRRSNSQSNPAYVYTRAEWSRIYQGWIQKKSENVGVWAKRWIVVYQLFGEETDLFSLQSFHERDQKKATVEICFKANDENLSHVHSSEERSFDIIGLSKGEKKRIEFK
eukprot:403182_1